MLSSLTFLSSLTLYPIATLPDRAVFHYTDLAIYTEDLSSYQLLKTEEGQSSSSEFAYTLDESGIGVKYDDWSISTFYRYEWYINYSSDAMKLYQDSLLGTDMQIGKNYQISIDVEHLQSKGIKLDWYKEWNASFATYLAGSFIDAQKMMSGSMSGYASKDTNGDYVGKLNLDYSYSEDVLFDREATAPDHGYGYSLDLGFDWQIEQELFLSVYARDLLNSIYWQHVPTSVATANTATAKTTKEGYININPTISGVHTYHDYVQHIPTKYQAKLSYIVSEQTAFSLSNLYVSDYLFTDIGWVNNWSGLSSELSFGVQTKAVGLKLTGKYGYIGIKADNLDYQKTSYLGLNWGVNIPL